MSPSYISERFATHHGKFSQFHKAPMLLFVALAQAALDLQDNPYQILGVSKDATREDIKDAYRKLTVRYHPDLNRDTDTSKQWIRITDAYEFLLDSKRRELFDEFGMITDSRMDYDPENNPFKEYQDQKYGNKRVKHEILIRTPHVIESTFQSHVSQRGEHLFLVLSGHDCPRCGDSLFYFEEFENKAKDIIGYGLIDLDESPELCKSLGVQSVPALVYMRREEKGFFMNVRSESLSSMRDVADFLMAQWPRRLYLLHDGNFGYFLKLMPQQVRVIEVTQKARESMAYARVASRFRSIAHFGLIANASEKWRKKFELERLPAYLLFRNPELKPMVTYNVSELGLWMFDWSSMTLFSADQYSVVRHCQDFCCLRCGFPDVDVAEAVKGVNVSTGWVEPTSNFAKKLGLVEGDWIAYHHEPRFIVRIDRTASEVDGILSFLDAARSGTVEPETLPDGLSVDWQVEPFVHETIRLGFYIWDSYGVLIVCAILLLVGFIAFRVMTRRRHAAADKKLK